MATLIKQDGTLDIVIFTRQLNNINVFELHRRISLEVSQGLLSGRWKMDTDAGLRAVSSSIWFHDHYIPALAA